MKLSWYGHYIYLIPQAHCRQERDPFILVLIDGDGMIFDDRLICQGEAGGKEAAALLSAAVAANVEQIMPTLRSDYKILTRLYANSRGLGEACYHAGVLPYPSLMEDFARGFTGKHLFFDFIDVGSGKDRADDKLSGEYPAVCLQV